MVKRVLLPIVVLTTGVVSAVQVQASRGLGPGDQIVRDYSMAKGFRQWTETLTKHSIPGDYNYLEQAYKVYPSLTKNDSLPKMNFEKDTFQIRDGLSEVKLQYFPGQPTTFAINGQKVEFNRYDLAPQKMRKLLNAMKKTSQASHFLFLPVAWAQGSGVPTKLSVAAFSVMSATQASESPVMSTRLSSLMENVKDTTLWQRFYSKNIACVQKIQSVEDVVSAQEKLDFDSMECSGASLRIHLSGTDDHGYNRDLVVDQDGFSVEQAPGKRPIISRYDLVSPDPVTKGYGDDEPVSETSSPAQREAMGGQYEAVGGADRAMMDRYMGAAVPAVRQFCSSSCAGTLQTYWKILQSSDKGTSSGTSSKGTH
jgi:hypothetical protein